MPDLTLTFTDNQETRFRAALQGAGPPVTKADAEAWLKERAKDFTLAVEAHEAVRVTQEANKLVTF